MLGTVVNTIAVVIGAVIGLFIKKGLSEKLTDALMKGLGLCTLFLGIQGSLRGENSLVLIISIVAGTIIGELVNLEDKISLLGIWLEKRVKKENGAKNSVAEGFITASLLFCVGALAVVGSLQSGLSGDYEMLFNKSTLDFVTALILASTLGVGVVFAAGFVFVYQGSITLAAQWIAPFLSERIINEMTCVGSVIIIGLAFNMLGITKLRIMNYLPAIFIPILLCRFM